MNISIFHCVQCSLNRTTFHCQDLIQLPTMQYFLKAIKNVCVLNMLSYRNWIIINVISFTRRLKYVIYMSDRPRNHNGVAVYMQTRICEFELWDNEFFVLFCSVRKIWNYFVCILFESLIFVLYSECQI